MIDGYVDSVSRSGVSGWSADSDRPEQPIDVTIAVDGVERGRVYADRARPDLRNLGTFGGGLHGFQFAFDPPLAADQDYEVVVCAADEGRPLRHGRALVLMDDSVRTAPVAYGPEPGQRPRGDISGLARYLIHVGPHKTGSTYLQKGFGRLRGALFELGVRYPMHWSDPGTKSHSYLVRRLKEDDPDLAQEFASLNSSANGTIILSSEDIVDLPVEALRRLTHLLGGQSVSVVFYCRRWSELIPSAWQEVVKQGSAQGLPEFLAQHLINPVGSTLVNYDQALARLSDVFGPENLHLVSYSNLVSSKTDLLHHFLETFINWTEPAGTTYERENTSLDIRDVELIRVLNALEIARNGHSSFDVCSRYLVMKPQLDLALIYAAMDSDVHEIAVNGASSGLRAVHETIFERYGGRLVQPRSQFNLFQLRATRVPFVAQNYLLSREILEMIMEIHRSLEEAVP
jgi:hypothetical protein